MNWEILFVFVLIIFALVSFVMEKLPTDLTAMCVLSVLVGVSALSGSERLPSISDVLGVFANPAPLTIAAMFVISAALERCGVIAVMSKGLGKLTFLGYNGLLFVLVLCVAISSAFINNTAVVVVLLPVVLGLARTMQTPASKFLIPLSYASIFGGCCTTIGTSTNILVSGILVAYDMPALEMFELSAVGVPLLLGSLIYLTIFANKLLPVRETLTSILSEEERKEYIVEAYVGYASPLVGVALKDSGLFGSSGLRVLEVVRSSVALQADLRKIILQAGDRLVLACHASGVVKARTLEGVNFTDEMAKGLEQIAAHEGAVVEGMVAPTSNLIGKTISEVNFSQGYGLVLMAVHRKGANLREKLSILRFEFGDTLLMMGTDYAIESLRAKSDDIILFDRPPIPAADVKRKMPLVLGILLGVVLSATFHLLPIVVAAIIGVTLLFLTRCVTPKEGYKAIEWRILILIYGMLALGLSMDKSGFSSLIAENMVVLGDRFIAADIKPYVMLACMYLATGLLTEILSNNATVVLMAPIAIGLATTIGFDPRPFVIACAIASSASFSTPIGYQTNTYVYGVGGYRFSDFWKIGLPLNVLYFAGCMLIIPRVWSF